MKANHNEKPGISCSRPGGLALLAHEAEVWNSESREVRASAVLSAVLSCVRNSILVLEVCVLTRERGTFGTVSRFLWLRNRKKVSHTQLYCDDLLRTVYTEKVVVCSVPMCPGGLRSKMRKGEEVVESLGILIYEYYFVLQI